MNKRSVLEIVEYLFIAGSLVGSIAAITTHQVAYAAIPITVSLLLNAVNRYRYQHYERRSVAKVHQSVQSLQQQVQGLPSEPVDNSSITQSIRQLEQKTLRLSEQLNDRPELAQLQNQLDAVSLQLDRLPISAPIDLSQIEAEIATLQAHLQTIDFNSVKQLEQRTLELSEQLNDRPELALTQLQNQLDAVSLRLDRLPSSEPIELSRIEAEIATLQAHLQAIDLNSSASTIALIQTELQAQIDQLKDEFQLPPTIDNTALEQRLAAVENSQTELSQPVDGNAIEQRLTELENNYTLYRDDVIRLVPAVQNLQSEQAVTSTAIASFSIADAQLASQLENLSSRLDTLIPEADSGIHDAIANLNLQLNHLTEQFNARPEPTAIHSLSEIVETQIPELASQLDALSQQFNTRTELQTIEHLEKTVDNLNLQLNNLTEQFNAQPEPSAIQDLDETLQLQVSQLALQFDTLSQQFNTRNELQTIEQLERTIGELQHNLESVVTPAIVNTPEQEATFTKDEATASFATKEELDSLTQTLTLALEELSFAIAELSQAGAASQLTETLVEPDTATIELPPSAEFDLEDLFAESTNTSVEQLNSATAEFDLEALFAEPTDTSVEQLSATELPSSAEFDLEALFADSTDASIEQLNPAAKLPSEAELSLDDLFAAQDDISIDQLNEAIASIPPGTELNLEDLLLALTHKTDAPKSAE